MYQGYNLDLQRNSNYFEPYYKKGKEINEGQKQIITRNLDYFKNLSGNLDANRLINEWFPVVEADIFLSHSHEDKRLVISLAGWLYEKFGLTSFIDSTVWGYSKELQKLIDKQYCMEPDGYFDYEKCGYSAAHVHMMLSSALTCMIDKCECLFFVNTPRSFTEEEMQEGKTLSPWIFFEIRISKIIRRKVVGRTPDDFISSKLSQESIDESLVVEYQLDLNHLRNIDIATLQRWSYRRNLPTYHFTQSLHPLDALYYLCEKKDESR